MNPIWQNYIVYTIVTISSAALIFHYWKKNTKKTKTPCNNCGCEAKKRLKFLS